MKRLIVLVVILLTVSGCAIAQPVKSATDPTTGLPYSIQRHVDREAQVVCWVYSGGYAGGLSCLPLAETALEEQYR